MKPSLDLLPSSSFQQSALTNRQQTSLSESYQGQKQGASIALTTREGDTITISQQSATSQYRQESITTDSYRTIEQSMRLDSMAISVQGDLSQQELDDLSRLLDDLSAIASNFFNGNLEDALTGAMNIGDMGSISRLEASFTRTSVLSNYLEGHHPLPTLGQNEINSLPAPTPRSNELTPGAQGEKEPRVIDLMTAQWQQFLDAIEHRPSRPYPQKNHTPPSQEMAAKEMLERAKETMSTHPRLTPLLPSIIGLALSQTAKHYQPHEAATLLAQSTSTALNSLFSDWVL